MLDLSYSRRGQYVEEDYTAHYSKDARNCDVLYKYDRLKSALEVAHRPTAEHCIRVRICAASLGETIGLRSNDLLALSVAAEIHDIGKLKVPTSILDKQGPLTESERGIIEMHSHWGCMLASSAFPTMPEIADSVLLHHERMDGSGYPYGYIGDEIPLFARLLAVADAFVALTEDRAFRPAYSDEYALHLLSCDEAHRYDQGFVEILRVRHNQ